MDIGVRVIMGQTTKRRLRDEGNLLPETPGLVAAQDVAGDDSKPAK